MTGGALVALLRRTGGNTALVVMAGGTTRVCAAAEGASHRARDPKQDGQRAA